MKKTVLLWLVVAGCLTASAQTMNIQVGDVTYLVPAAEAGDMTYSGGTSLTVMGKTFHTSDISQITVDETVVTDNTVQVAYSGTTAKVVVAGNIMQNLTVKTNGAHVSIVQDENVTDEIIYTLSGSTTNGSFYMDGSLKTTVILDGVTINNPDSAAINIRDGKRIAVELRDGTTSTLTDGMGGQQKACFAVKGHAEISGSGTLNITGKTAHAFWGKEYVQLKKSVGTINILGAVGDGFNVNQFFQQNGGNVTISGVGDDGIQVSYKTDDNDVVIPLTEDEDNTGIVLIKGGKLNITVTGTAAKAIKSEGTVDVEDGTLTLKASGALDLTDASDPSYTAGIKAESFVQNGGTITMTVTGTAGRGVSATDITTNGGTLDITNSGAGQTGTNDDYTAKGLKGKNIALNAGKITINMSGTGGKGIRAGEEETTSSGYYSNTTYTGSYTQGMEDGSGPELTVNTTGSSLGSSSSGGGWGGGWGPGGGGPGGSSSGSSAKAIKALCTAVLYGGETVVATKTDGAEGLESKTSIDIRGGKHYFQCYDDCINSSGKIFFNGGVTVCYSNGNDAVDSNAGTTGAVTIGNGAVFAFTTKGAPEEGIDCDNNSYIQITGTGVAISAGASQGGGGGGGWGPGGGSSSGSTISNAAQGYAFITGSISYQTNRYYTLADSNGKNLVTYSFPALCSSSLGLFTATGMVKNGTYTIKYSTTAPTDATTAWHGLYLGSSASGLNSVTSFTAK